MDRQKRTDRIVGISSFRRLFTSIISNGSLLQLLSSLMSSSRYARASARPIAVVLVATKQGHLHAAQSLGHPTRYRRTGIPEYDTAAVKRRPSTEPASLFIYKRCKKA
jgi:hypothetical protein